MISSRRVTAASAEVRPSSSCLPKGVRKIGQAAPEGGSPGFARRPQDFGRDGGPRPARPDAGPTGLWPGATTPPSSSEATKSAAAAPESKSGGEASSPTSSASSPTSPGQSSSLWRFGGWDRCRRRRGRRRWCWWWRWRRKR